METEQLQQAQATHVSGDASTAQAPFFQVSVRKFVVLSICTFGLYEVYWFYKNWQLIRDREDIAVTPWARALFAIFYCYQAFCRIRDFPTAAGFNSSLAAGPLAAGWIIATLLANLPDPFWLVTFFAVVFMVPVQATAQGVNAVVAPMSDPNSRFSVGNWIAVVIGGALFILSVIGSFMGEE